jgi:hypothetical protein
MARLSAGEDCPTDEKVFTMSTIGSWHTGAARSRARAWFREEGQQLGGGSSAWQKHGGAPTGKVEVRRLRKQPCCMGIIRDLHTGREGQ